MLKNKKILLLIVFSLILINMPQLGGIAAADTIKIVGADCGWDSQMFHNAVAELIIEHAYDGYEFEVSTASSPMNWQAMIAGDVDLYIECWPDNMPTYPGDVAAGDILKIGLLAKDGKQGIYVPRYVIEGDPERGIEPIAPGLKSVKDMKRYSHLFPDEENPKKGRMYGAIPGWVADEILHNKYKYYGLDENYTYMRLGSEGSLFASLAAAYNLGEPWIGYCYEPTWIAGRLDIVMLEDEPYDAKLFHKGETAFPYSEMLIVSSAMFAERAPELMEFFGNYRTGSALISETLAYLDETKASYKDVAVWFLKKNDNLIDEWLPKEKAEKLRAYLAAL